MAVGVRSLASLIPHVSAHEVCELLYEFPGVSCACPWEPLLDDLNGFNSQGKIGGDGECLLVVSGAARVRGKGVLRLPARSHVLTLSVDERGEVGVKRARINLLVPRLAALLTKFR